MRTSRASTSPSADRLSSFDDPRAPTGSGRLKLLLKVLDTSGLCVGWLLAVMTTSGTAAAGPLDRAQLGLLGVIGVVAALIVMASKRLWLSRVCAVRSAELEGLGATAVLSALAVLVAGDVLAASGPARFGVLGASLSFVLVVAGRAAYAAWLRRARRRGRYVRRLVMVGDNRQAVELARLINDHPDSGYRVVGQCGANTDPQDPGDDVPHLGSYREAPSVVQTTHADGALVVAGAMSHGQLNRIVRQLMRTGTHVHLSSGMRGIAQDRIIPLPVAREPLFYVERLSLTRSQLAVKRGLDLVFGSVLALALAPVAALAAVVIKLEDGGPALFRQERVGRDGRHFTLFKLRTMVPEAERQVIDLTDANDRQGGPLFKLRRDPRVTRVGRLLRATSVDEIPQLLNVIRGDMSLVGPRPALPTEVVQFDDELRERRRMPPGITGLWQVEARDDPSFSSYRRLDLYYIENWSIGLDLAVLAATVGVVLKRGARLLFAGASERS